MRIVLSIIAVGWLGSTAAGQAPPRPPIIDVHVHSTNTSPQQALERMKSLNIRFLVVSSLTSDLGDIFLRLYVKDMDRFFL